MLLLTVVGQRLGTLLLFAWVGSLFFYPGIKLSLISYLPRSIPRFLTLDRHSQGRSKHPASFASTTTLVVFPQHWLSLSRDYFSFIPALRISANSVKQRFVYDSHLK